MAPSVEASHSAEFNFSFIESHRRPITLKDGKSLSLWSRTDSGGAYLVSTEDISLAALMYMEHFEKTGDQESLKRAKDGLDYLMAVQKEGGLFPAIYPEKEASPENPEIQAPDMDSAYAFHAISMGFRIFKPRDPDYTRALMTHLDRTISCFQSFEEKNGRNTPPSIQGIDIPAGLIGGRSDITALYVLGLLECQEGGREFKEPIYRHCNAIKSFSGTSYEEFPFGGFYQNAGHFTSWRLAHNRQMSALALAGKKFSENTWIDSAEKEANGLYTHFLASYGPIPAMAPAPVIYPQDPAATETMTSNLVHLFKATGKEHYALMAGLTASWFYGNNEKGESMFDKAAGKGYISLDSQGKSSKADAAASVLAIKASLEIMNTPAMAHSLCRQKGAPHAFQVLEAEEGKAVRKDYEIEETIYPGGVPGKNVVIKRENSFWIKFDITRENNYDFYLIFLRQTGFDMGTSIMMRIDGDKIFSVPLGGAIESPYMCMKEVVEPRLLLPGLHSLGIRFSGLLHSKSTVLDSVVLQPAVEWKVFSCEGGALMVLAKSFHRDERHLVISSLGIPNLHATSVTAYTRNGTLAEERKDDLTPQSHIKIPGYGYAIIRGK
jgi:hypothetical protein